MNFLIKNIYVIVPEIIIFIIICIILFIDLFIKSDKLLLKKYAIISYISIFGLILAIIYNSILLSNYKNTDYGIYNFITNDHLTQLMKLFIYVIVIFIFLFSREYIIETNIPFAECHILILFSVLGMILVISSNSLLTMYLGIELLSLPLYSLIAIRKIDNIEIEASLKYFFTNIIASGIMLYGFSFLYGLTGKIDFAGIHYVIIHAWHAKHNIFLLSFLFIFVGVCLKLGLFPFHMWIPDVYQGSPTIITLLFNSIIKISILGMIIRLFSIGFINVPYILKEILIVMILISIGFGNILAIIQNNIKRILAYSSISHMSYAMLGLFTGTKIGYTATLYYILMYAITSLIIFLILIVLESYKIRIKNIYDISNMNIKSSWISFIMLITIFSMAGIPPTVGFFAKFFILQSLISSNLFYIAIISLILSITGIYYYIRIIKVIYFNNNLENTISDINLSIKNNILFFIMLVLFLYFGLFPSHVMTICFDAFRNFKF